MSGPALCPRCTLQHAQIDLDYSHVPAARAFLHAALTGFCHLNHRRKKNQ